MDRTTAWRHSKRSPHPVRPESPPPPKRRRTTHSQAGQESFVITSDKQKRSRTDNISSTSHSRVDASDHPQFSTSELHAPSNQSDDEDSEGAIEGDAVEATDHFDYETDDFWNGEDVAVEGDVDPREGIVSDWDLLTEEFIVEAEELGRFGHSSLHTS